MAGTVKKSKAEIATIDCCLVTIETSDGEFGFDTANKIEVEPQIEEEDAVKGYYNRKGLVSSDRTYYKPAFSVLQSFYREF